MKVLVIGAGVLGSLYAARLAVSGCEVTLIARGARLAALQRGPVQLFDEAGRSRAEVTVDVAASLDPDRPYDLALVMVRAEQIESLLPDLSALPQVGMFLFMHNRAAGSEALADAVGAERLLIGFPGAGGELRGDVVRYGLISEQPTTLGEFDRTLSPRLLLIADTFRKAGFQVALSRHMDGWLKSHAMFATAIAGAIYLAGGSASQLARRAAEIRLMVLGIREGFAALSRAGVVVEPRKLRLLFSLPPLVPEVYWRRYMARPSADLIFTRHARNQPAEMWWLVQELHTRVAIPEDSALAILWEAVRQAATEHLPHSGGSTSKPVVDR